MHSQQLGEIAAAMRLLQRRAVGAIVGAGLLVTASVLYSLQAGGPQLAGVPVSAWLAGIGGAWALLAAWPRR
jgi:ubiquinone biosynthesis protein